MEKSFATVIEANPDCVQLSLGQARAYQLMPGKSKPGLVLRTDAANIYGKDLPRHLFSELVDRGSAGIGTGIVHEQNLQDYGVAT